MSPKCIEARTHSTSFVLFGYCGRTIGLGGMFIGMQLRVAAEVKIDAKCIYFFRLLYDESSMTKPYLCMSKILSECRYNVDITQQSTRLTTTHAPIRSPPSLYWLCSNDAINLLHNSINQSVLEIQLYLLFYWWILSRAWNTNAFYKMIRTISSSIRLRLLN